MQQHCRATAIAIAAFLCTWQDLTPPKDANVRVMVLRDHGSITFSHSASVPLVKGSVHNLKCSEAEHLVRMGVLQVLDPNC